MRGKKFKTRKPTNDRLTFPTGGKIAETLFVCGLLLVLCAAARAQTEFETITSGESFTVVSTGTAVILPITKRAEIFAAGSFIARPKDGANAKLAVVDIRYKINKRLTVASGYFGFFPPRVGRRRIDEQRLRLSATLNFQFKKISVADQNLFERRFRPAGTDSNYYRNKIEAQRTFKIAGSEFAFYGSVEPFYDFAAKKIARTHTQFGARKKLGQRLSVDVSYLRAFVRNGGDVNAAVVGLVVRLPQLFGEK